MDKATKLWMQMVGARLTADDLDANGVVKEASVLRVHGEVQDMIAEIAEGQSDVARAVRAEITASVYTDLRSA